MVVCCAHDVQKVIMRIVVLGITSCSCKACTWMLTASTTWPGLLGVFSHIPGMHHFATSLTFLFVSPGFLLPWLRLRHQSEIMGVVTSSVKLEFGKDVV